MVFYGTWEADSLLFIAYDFIHDASLAAILEGNTLGGKPQRILGVFVKTSHKERGT